VVTDREFDARFIDRDAQPTLAIRIQIPMAELDMGAVYGRELPRLFVRMQELGGDMGGAPYGRYFAWGGEQVDVEIGLVLGRALETLRPLGDIAAGEIGASELPAGHAAVATHWGPYDTLPETYGRLHDWIHAQGREDGLGPWESYMDDPDSVPDAADVRTEVCYPLTDE
jgi:effector-binding domain-containing protein